MSGSRVFAFVQRNERRLIVVWLGGCFLSLFVAGYLGLARGGVDRGVRAWNRRWFGRLELAQDAAVAGRHQEAVARLEYLDRQFPATWVKHRYERYRELILELLGNSEAELGNKRRALDAHERLAAFDPRSWRNHFVLAETRRRFDEPDDAREAYARVLELHPTHLLSLAAQIEMRLDAGDFTAVPLLYETYLDAWLIAPMELRLGEATRAFEVPVDGREHTIEVVVNVDEGWGGELCLETKGYSVVVASVELLDPLRVGSARASTTTIALGARGWSGRGVEVQDGGAWSALGPDAVLCRLFEDGDVARLRLKITAFKALGGSLWRSVESSYGNVLDLDGLAAARARTVVGGCPEAGSIFLDL